MARPTVKECISKIQHIWTAEDEDIKVEIIYILRTLDAGHDPRTVRVGEDGKVERVKG